jgi:hypothetical protein
MLVNINKLKPYRFIEDTTYNLYWLNLVLWSLMSLFVTTPLWRSVRMTLTPEMGTWESSGTFENSKFNYRGQNTSPWGVLYTVGKVLKCRCRKWPCMSHSDIYNTSYGWKKGHESNWQFDSQPLKVGNRLDPGMCRWSATHRCKFLEENYKFASNLTPIGGLSKELWTPKIRESKLEQFRDFSLGVSGKNAIRM